MIETLAHYRILGRIGVGRMGDLYRARDTRAGRTVALRVVAAAIADDARFLPAARAAAALSHPNIAALYEIGADRDRVFLVSEYVPGDTLKTVIAGRALNPRHALDHGIQLADALAEAHASGVAHRDIGPGNIMITPKGNAKFLDFGLGEWTGSGEQRSQAATRPSDAGPAPAAVAYMSPEQVLGEQTDDRTDIFSLGVVVFEMLTGTPPFAGTDANALTMQILQAQPRAPSALNRTLPAELDPIVVKMLAKSLDHRYEAAATVAAELRSVAAILDVRDGVAEPVNVAEVVSRRPRGAAFWFAVALVAGFIVTALVLMWRA